MSNRRTEKKTIEHESDGDTNCIWHPRYSHQRIGIRTGRLGNMRTRRDCLKYGIVDIGKNIK